jgi:hypothetical protein
MTARARITPSDLAQAAAVAKAAGVAVTITAPNGKTFTVAPVDASGESAQHPGSQKRSGGNTCDGVFGGRR